MIAVRIATLLAACILIPAVLSERNIIDATGDYEPFLRSTINENNGYKDTGMKQYETQINPRFRVPALNAPPNQEMYEVWKRNANIINTLLGVPRRMLMAGR